MITSDTTDLLSSHIRERFLSKLEPEVRDAVQPLQAIDLKAAVKLVYSVSEH